ncbi:hypothetical protein GMMP1_500023 [Candidatus Magnetomoraceae bacterium gMMP-1]
MIQQAIKYKNRILLIVTFLIFVFTGNVYAGSQSSSYIMQKDVVSADGGSSSSTNYNLLATLAQSSPVGKSASGNNILYGGFRYSNNSGLKYTLNLSKDGNGKVQVNGVLHNLSWSGQFDENAVLSLEAVPAADWKFVFWSGLGTENPIDITMDGDKSIKANFVQNLPEISVTPESFDFGNVNTESQSTARTFTVSDTGNADLIIGTISVTGSDSSLFAKQNDNCSGQTLGSSETCTVEVVFSPDSENTFLASLNIPSNDPDTAAFSVSLTGTGILAQDCFSDYLLPKPTTTVMDLYGTIYNAANQVIADGDEIAAFVDDGNGNLVLVGHAIYGQNVSGGFGLMHVYGDDTTTPEKDGAVSDDTLILKTCNKTDGMEYPLKSSSGQIVWEEGNQKEVDLIYLIKQKIPLHAGWNLISFGVNKCYYIDAKPNVTMIEGIEYEEVDSINDILISIDGQYSYVRGFDSTGAKSYNLSPWSDMKYMAAGYGYWIKIKEDADFDEKGLIYLELEGLRVPGDKAISLQVGWNLIGTFGNQVQYKGVEPNVHFPDDIEMYPVNDVSEIFSSIDGQYSYVRGFDKTGAKSYNLSPWSDLRYAGPGYAYWIKVKDGESPSLVWED